MSTRTLHPALAVGDMIDLFRDGVREVNGISNLDDIRLIQACAEAAELDVMWKLTRNGQQALLVEIPPPATAQSIVSDFIAQVETTGLRAAIYVECDGGTITAQPHELDVRVLTPEQMRARDERIIRAALEWGIEYTRWPTADDWDAIIAAAEVGS